MARQPMRGLGMETDFDPDAPSVPQWSSWDEQEPVEDPEAPQRVDMRAVAQRAYKAEKQARETDKYQALLADMTGGGGPVLQHIALLLAKRIDELIAADPEAKAYMTVLQHTGAGLAVGKKFADMELSKLFEDAL